MAGLFHRVIAQSGSALASFSIHSPSLEFHSYIEDVFRLLKCRQKTRLKRIECLRKLPWETITNMRKNVSTISITA